MTNKWLNPEQFQSIWKDVIDLQQEIIDAAEKGVERHTDLFNDVPEHEARERLLMKDIFDLIQKKWLLNIVNALAFHNHLYFNDIKKHLGDISSKTLSERLKELVKIDAIHRIIEEEHSPIRVRYSLTKFGRGLHHSFIPFVIYFFKRKET